MIRPKAEYTTATDPTCLISAAQNYLRRESIHELLDVRTSSSELWMG